MKLISLLKKNLLLQIRDYWALLITLSMGPFFAVVYWVISMGFPSYYNVLVVNNDKGFKNKYHGSEFVNLCLSDKKIQETIHVKLIHSVDSGKSILKRRDADAMVMIPENFSKTLYNSMESLIKDTLKPQIYFYGEKSNTRYLVGVITSYSAIDAYIKYMVKVDDPWKMIETFIDEEKLKRTDFELTVPGIFMLAIVMLLFSAGMLIIRDVEDKSLDRLKLTKMTIFDYIAGVTITQLMVGVISVLLTIAVATLLGFRNVGSSGVVILVCILSFIGIIGITFMVTSFCKNATIFVIAGQFPLFILVFFTGAMMPIPRNPLFYIFDYGICWNDFLPVTVAVNCLNGIFNDGKTIGELTFQLSFLTFISLIYLFSGLFLFNIKHLRLQS